MRCPKLSQLPLPPPDKKGWPWTEESRQLPDAMDCGEPWPRVSILTPSYNQAEFIEATIRSVLLQGYPNLEYIIIDGGSTDGTVEVIKKYEAFLAHWTSEPDEGQSDAINKGFMKSTGDVVGWQNSDDIYFPHAIFSSVKVLRKHRSVSLVFGNTKIIDEQGRECGELRFAPFRRWSLLYEGMMLTNQSAFWRREIFSRAGLFDTSLNFCMDYEFFLRASLHCKFKFHRRFQGAFRIHGNSKSASIHDTVPQEQSEVLRQLKVAPNGSRKARFWRTLSLTRRAFWYVVQGDIAYLFRGAIRRSRK